MVLSFRWVPVLLATAFTGCAARSAFDVEIDQRKARIASLREQVQANQARLQPSFAASGQAETGAKVAELRCAAVASADLKTPMRSGRYATASVGGASGQLQATLSAPRQTGRLRISEGRCGGARR